MHPFTRSDRRAARRSPPLTLEQLPDRLHPGGLWTGGDTVTTPAVAPFDPFPGAVVGRPPPVTSSPIEGDPSADGPVIVDFTATEVAHGLYRFTGRVIADSPGGLVVRFGGEPVSVAGLTAVTEADGTFSLLVIVHTDGSDSGYVTAVTQDAQGHTSNTPGVYITPTP